jgi:hypothetical protein
VNLPIWIKGASRSGKTTRLVREFSQWIRGKLRQEETVREVALASGDRKEAKTASGFPIAPATLVFAANNNNRRNLADRLSSAIEGSYPVICKTPLGFISDEVMLFWPLLFERLNLKAQFPLRLRPETEQALATNLWRERLQREDLGWAEVGEYRLVRCILDLLQLAGASNTPTEAIGKIISQGLPDGGWSAVNGGMNCQSWEQIGELLLDWRQWCLDRGLLSYGIIYEIYGRYLLNDVRYQYHLLRRFQAIFADDVDDYPAIARDLFEFLLDRGAFAVFTYNPNGKVRLGLNADPNYLGGLASRAAIEELQQPTKNLNLGELAIELIQNPGSLVTLPESIRSIQTISRAEMLRQTAEIIIEAVEKKEIEPPEIAIIAPGLDEITRYSLIEMLSARGIAVEPLNEQRPLISWPIVRAILTLLALVYRGLGRLVDRDAVAEMLVVLSHKPSSQEGKFLPDIDPVRAGLLADYCYHIDPEQPCLLLVESSFPRWDRLGHKATTAYREIVGWLEETKKLLQQERFFSAISIIDRAIEHFFPNGSNLPYDRLAALRELMETAQHYWEVDRRLRQNEPNFEPSSSIVANFIELLRCGTITANPLPTRTLGVKSGGITLANIFQYRSLRGSHRWHFWLDPASILWQKGGAATLFGYELFLKEWNEQPIMPENEYEAEQQLLKRILLDLLARVEERVYLCHSDLGINGAEQMGPLLSLVNVSQQFVWQ